MRERIGPDNKLTKNATQKGMFQKAIEQMTMAGRGESVVDGGADQSRRHLGHA